MQEKLTIIASKRVGKLKTLQTKITVNDLHDATLCKTHLSGYMTCWTKCLFLAFLAYQFLRSHHVLFSTRVSWSAKACLWSVLHVSRTFLVKCPVLPFCSLSSKIPSLSSVNRIFWTGKVFSQCLVFLLNGMLYYQYIVTALKIIYNNIVRFCLQTSEMYLELNVI